MPIAEAMWLGLYNSVVFLTSFMGGKQMELDYPGRNHPHRGIFTGSVRHFQRSHEHCGTAPSRRPSRLVQYMWWYYILWPFFFDCTISYDLGNGESKPNSTYGSLLSCPCSLLGPFTFYANSKYFLFHPSHPIFGRVHRVLNIDKK
jgi:hypothetical protein